MKFEPRTFFFGVGPSGDEREETRKDVSLLDEIFPSCRAMWDGLTAS